MRNRRLLALVGLVALLSFGVAFYVSLDRPGVTTAVGYYGWSDQLNYRLETRALGDGILPGIDFDYHDNRAKASYNVRERPLYDYAYGLGYPVLAVLPSMLGMRSDPFALPDALMFAADVIIIVVLGTRLRSRAFGLVAAAALVFATPFLAFTVVPWSNTVTTLAVLVALLVVTDPDEHPVGHALALGVAVGMCFAARYVDALFPATIGGIGLLMRRPRSLRPVVGAAVVALVLAIPVLWSQEAVFGNPFTTPYAHHMVRGTATSDQGLGAFDPGRIPRSFWEVFVSGDAAGARTPASPMLAVFPWGVLAPVGLYALFRERRAGRRAFAIATAVSVVGSAFYLSFRGATGADLVNHDLRYFVTWVPLWALLAAYGAVFLVARTRSRLGREPEIRLDALDARTGNDAPLAQPPATVRP